MKLLVVILCYRVPELTIDCLRSLSSEVGSVPGTRVVVCENGSGGDAVEQIQRAIDENGWGDWASLVPVYPNRGFCAGNNLVIRQVLDSGETPEYIHLLNADTIVKPNVLKSLVDFLDQHPKAGIAGSHQVDAQGVPNISLFRFVNIGTEVNRGGGLGWLSNWNPSWSVVPPAPLEAARADWVPGTSMLLRRSMLDEIGLLDEGLYTYFDDLDICWRAHQAGWETWYVPESQLIHLVGQSTGVTTPSNKAKRKPAYWFQARRRFFLKSYGGLYTAFADAGFLSALILTRIRCWILRRPDGFPQHMFRDSFRHSVFCTGFRVTEVENPALQEVANQSRTSAPVS